MDLVPTLWVLSLNGSRDDIGTERQSTLTESQKPSHELELFYSRAPILGHTVRSSRTRLLWSSSVHEDMNM